MSKVLIPEFKGGTKQPSGLGPTLDDRSPSVSVKFRPATGPRNSICLGDFNPAIQIHCQLCTYDWLCPDTFV